MYFNVKELADKIGCSPREVLDNSAHLVDYWEFTEKFYHFSDFADVEHFLKVYPGDINWPDVWLRVNHQTENFQKWFDNEMWPTPIGWDKVETSVE